MITSATNPPPGLPAEAAIPTVDAICRRLGAVTREARILRAQLRVSKRLEAERKRALDLQNRTAAEGPARD